MRVVFKFETTGDGVCDMTKEEFSGGDDLDGVLKQWSDGEDVIAWSTGAISSRGLQYILPLSVPPPEPVKPAQELLSAE